MFRHCLVMLSNPKKERQNKTTTDNKHAKKEVKLLRERERLATETAEREKRERDSRLQYEAELETLRL